jgi:multiple PDZ domain protein
MKEWSERLGPEFLIVVAHIQKFRESSGLGISLEGTVDMTDDGQEVCPHHYIRAILPDGPVGLEGSLTSGDEILEVNGIELVSKNHVEVVSLLKELPIKVDMVCARKKNGVDIESRRGTTTISVNSSTPSLNDPNLVMSGSDTQVNNRGTNIISINNNNNDVSVNKNNMWIMDNKKSVVKNNAPSIADRLVKAKSDGSLAIGIASGSMGISPVVLTDDSSRIRSRSLEPLTGLAMWSSEPLLIQLYKGERGLGFSILDYQDPMNPNDTVIVVRSLVPGGVAQTDGRLIPGDRLISVNGVNLENASLDEAVQALKGAPRGYVEIQVAKPLPLPESETMTQSLHPDYFMISARS